MADRPDAADAPRPPAPALNECLFDGIVSFTGSLEEPPEMNRTLWALPLVVKLVQMLHRKHDNTIFSDNMQRNSRLGIPDFLSGPLAFLQVAKHPHISDWEKYAVLVERSSDIQELIRHMFPGLLEEFHCAMAMNLAVGVTYWEWTNELILDLLPDHGGNPFGFPSERDAQLSLLHRLGTVISEWDVGMRRFHGRLIQLAGYTVNTNHRRFQGVVPDIANAKFYHQEIARKFGAYNVANGSDYNDGDGNGDDKRRGKRARVVQ